MDEIFGSVIGSFLATLASGCAVLAGLVSGFVWVMFRMS